MNDYIAYGAKSYIRAIKYDDTDLIVKWRNQDNVSRYFFYRETFTEDIHKDWIKNKVEMGEVAQFIVCMKDDDRPVGSAYLRDINNLEGTAEYGVFLGEEDIRDQGIGKEVLALTLEYAWNELGLKKVMSRAIEGNKASINSFLHSGFVVDDKVTDVECSDGEKVDMVLMSICRP